MRFLPCGVQTQSIRAKVKTPQLLGFPRSASLTADSSPKIHFFSAQASEPGKGFKAIYVKLSWARETQASSNP